MYQKRREAFIAVTAVILVLLGSLLIYNTFVKPKPANIDMFIKENLKDEWQPDKFDVNMNIKRSTLSGKEVSKGWYNEGEKALFSSFVHLNDDGEINDQGIMVKFTSQPFTVINDSAISMLINKYFKNTGDMPCELSSGIIFCGKVSLEANGDKSCSCLAVDSKSAVSMLSCRIPAESKNFGWSSCEEIYNARVTVK